MKELVGCGEKNAHVITSCSAQEVEPPQCDYGHIVSGRLEIDMMIKHHTHEATTCMQLVMLS